VWKKLNKIANVSILILLASFVLYVFWSIPAGMLFLGVGGAAVALVFWTLKTWDH
jgi:small-conductance mechanosensitive channel